MLTSASGDQLTLSNGVLPLLVQLLHEHTIDDILEHQTLQQFNTKFLSIPNIERRLHSSQILRTIVEDSSPTQTQLEVLRAMESLRCVIENIYKEYSVPEFRSTIQFDAVLSQLLNNLRELLYRGYHSPSGFDSLQLFGGVYVLLDILFLDHRLSTEYSTSQQNICPSLTSIHQWSNLREVTILLIERLICHVDDVKRMFARSQPLLSLLAETYRNDNNNVLIRNTIANSFKKLAIFEEKQGRIAGYRNCKVLQYFTENAIKCSKSEDNEDNESELVNSLEVISQLIQNNRDCRTDYVEVDGSMDLLIDLFDDNRGFDWNWTLGYWTYDFREIVDYFEEGKHLIYYVFLLIFGLSDLSFDRAVKFIFWIFPFKSCEQVFNYYRAKWTLSSPFCVKFSRACVSIAEYIAIIVKYLLLFALIVIFFYPIGLKRFRNETISKKEKEDLGNLFGLLLIPLFYLIQLSFKPPRKLHLAGDILAFIAPQVCNNPGAVWRFRHRDAYDLLFGYLYIWTYAREVNHKAFKTIQKSVLHRKPETNAEKKRFKEFKAANRIATIRRGINWIHRTRLMWTVWTTLEY